jgi:CBS domain-containing protein
MRAIDVMVRDVVTVHPYTEIAEAVKLLAEHDVSALPVVDGEGKLLGILSEADLMHRVEIGTEKRRPWWQEAVTGAGTLAEEFAKSHGKKVGEIMTSEVVAVSEETPLSEIATLFERKRIKRVPVTEGGKLVGVVSRSNLIQALASVAGRMDEHDETDRQIRLDLLSRLRSNPGPILAAATLPSAASCIYGASSDRLPNARHCLPLREVCQGYREFPTR